MHTVATIINSQQEVKMKDFQVGYYKYIAGASESACTNYAQIAGWYEALYQEVKHSQACRPGLFPAQEFEDAPEFLTPESSIEDDYEWIRWGC
jgi:hypothetical protein